MEHGHTLPTPHSYIQDLHMVVIQDIMHDINDMKVVLYHYVNQKITEMKKRCDVSDVLVIVHDVPTFHMADKYQLLIILLFAPSSTSGHNHLLIPCDVNSNYICNFHISNDAKDSDVTTLSMMLHKKKKKKLP